MSIVIKSGSSTNTANVGPGGDFAVSLTNPNAAVAGIFAGITPFGQLSVAVDGMPLFTDVFEGGTIDTTNRWTTAGTAVPTIANSNMVLAPSTTANATSVVYTQPSFQIATSLTFGVQVTVESGTVTGNHRFWGFGTAPSVPGSAAAPLQDAVGFEIDTTGTLRASSYSGGVRIFTQALGGATDGLPHTYVVTVRGDIAFFYKDTFDLPLATTYVGPAVKVLPLRFASLNSGAVVGTPTMTVAGLSVLDSARTAQSLSDGTYPWRKARIDTTGAINVAQRSTDLVVSVTGSSGAAVTATLPAAGTGMYHYINKIAVTKYATAAVTGSASPTVVTTTNIPGSMAYTLATAMPIGSSIDRIDDFTGAPLKVAATNTATTIAAPGTASIIWRLTVQYYVGP